MPKEMKNDKETTTSMSHSTSEETPVGDDDGGDDDVIVETSIYENEEIQSYCRIIKCTVLLLVVWGMILWLTEHHDDTLAWLLLGIMLLWFLYMLVYVCMVLCSIRALAARSSNATTTTTPQRGDGVLLVDDHFNNNDGDDGIIQSDSDDDDEENADRLLQFGFDETPQKIRGNRQRLISPNKKPKDGIYTVVYSATYFGKAMRSENKLDITFQYVKDDSGWDITGKSGVVGKSSSNTTKIEEGFLNPLGEMYWITQNCIYRGVLNLDTLTMFDGEFLTKKSGNQTVKGRVVRLEYDTTSTRTRNTSTKASTTNKDIEMSAIGSNVLV